MRLNEALKILGEDSLIASMPPAVLARIQRMAKIRTIARGASVVHQGEAADRLIIPIDGALRLVARSETGSTTMQLAARRSLNLGEVLAGRTWTYAAFAETELNIFELEAKRLRDALGEDPRYARYLERMTTSRSLREASGTLRRAGIHPRSLQQLLSDLEERTLAAGEVIAEPVWLIVERGALVVSREDAGEVVELTSLAPGEFYGGASALGRTVALPMRAVEPSVVLVASADSVAKEAARDEALGRILRAEHAHVQRRVRRALIDAGQELTKVMQAAESPGDAAMDDEARPPLGRAWSLGASRARRLEGFSCTDAEDSAAAALASVLKFFDRPVTQGGVRRALMRRTPASLLDLAKVAERQGLLAQAAQVANPRRLIQLRAPFLMVVGDRIVVVHEVLRRAIRVFDPMSGFRHISHKELLRAWSGLTLSFRDVRPILAELGAHAEAADAKEGGASSDKDKNKSDKRKKPLRNRLAPYMRLVDDVRGSFAAVTILSAAAFGLGLIAPKLNGLIVDQVLVYGDVGLLGVVAIGMVLIHLSSFALSAFRDRALNYFSGILEYRLSAMTLRHTLGVPLATHGEARVGTALSRLGELGRVRNLLATDIISTVISTVQGFIFLGLVFTYSVKLGMIVVIGVPLSAGIIMFGNRRYRVIFADLFEENSKSQSEITEQIEQIATIKALSGGPASQRRWEKALVARVNVEKRVLVSQMWIGSLLKIIQDAVRIFGMYVGIKLVLSGELSAGGMIAVTQYTSGALGPLVSFATKLDEFQQLGVSLRRVDDLFKHAVEDDETTAVRSDVVFEGAIHARDLCFAYPDGPQILRNITFDIHPGQTVAIVGRSGSGKTTLAKLLHGGFRPTSGELRYDDVDAATMSLPTIRRNVGMLLQEGQLFAGTILDNIAYADDRPDDVRVGEVARLAAAHDFISAFPKKYETYLAEGGLGLSGGQRQRICLARTLYGRPQVLIMDEATSALDAESERAILGNMRDILKGRTAIVIAHRLNTVKHADRILVIDEGEIVEDGSHDELVAKRGLYFTLFNQQFQQN